MKIDYVNVDEVNQAWEQINHLLIRLEQAVGDGKRVHVVNFRETTDTFSLNVGRLLTAVRNRQDLIDLQIGTTTFSGELHEDYHRAMAEIEADLNNFFVGVKTSLNRLSRMICEVLPHSDRNSLRNRSFGSQLESFQSLIGESDLLGALKLVFLRYGKDLDTISNKYRDKYIEHSGTGHFTALSSTGNQIGRLHYKPTAVKHGPQPAAKDEDTVMQLLAPGGAVIYYVHCVSSIDSQKKVKKGELVGYISDGGSGHFGKYGSHMHVFSDRNKGIYLADHFGKSFTMESVSPDPFEVVSLYNKFVEQILQLLVRATI